ncbi:MAG: SH3 domain-containing protein [Lewinellaceae bacterium]|nr:SH3 domain-containing protein [Lewinellaceae bacterium]
MCFFFCLSVLSAQQTYLFQWNPNDTVAVFGDKINVRSQPSTDATAVTQLVAGDEVIIEEVSTQSSTLNGVTLPWYKVHWNNKKSSGFVWGGLLSIMSRAVSSDTRFVAGVLKSVKKSANDIREYSFEIRAVRKGEVSGKVTTTIQTEGSVYLRQIEHGARDLKGYSTLMILAIGYETCGNPLHEWYVLWNGSQLSALPVCKTESDGGDFYHAEYYVFPQEGPDESRPGHYGDESQVFFSVEQHEREDREDNTGWDENRSVRARLMRWDGKQWIKPK